MSSVRLSESLLSIFRYLLFLFIVASPINYSYETLAMFRGEIAWGGWAVPLTPIYIKVVKDLFLVVCLFIGFFAFLQSSNNRYLLSRGVFFHVVALYFVALFLVAFYSVFSIGVDVVFAGVRAYSSLLYIVIGALLFREKDKLISSGIFFVFFIHLAVQVVQYINELGVPVFGENRNPGLFLVPTIAGGFSLLVYHFGEEVNSFLLKGLAVFSIYLSSSTMGLMVVVLYLIYTNLDKGKRYPELFITGFFVSILSLYLIVDNFGEFSGRGDGAFLSMETRAEYVLDVLSDFGSLMFGAGLGIATSHAVITGIPGAIVADNVFTGALLNVGWIPTAILISIFVYSFFLFKSKLLFFAFIGYAMVSNVFESTPVIQLLLLLLGAHAREYYSGRLFKNNP